MSLLNLELLYNNLPARFRRDDEDLFLKRFLQFYGETLEQWDALYDSFFENIDPETASEEFIDFWLDALFGWSWFPAHFTLQQKRTLYANFAQHLARRGTRQGIELWMRDFGACCAVWLREQYWDECYFGEEGWTVDAPLLIVVELVSLKDWDAQDAGTWDESFWDEEGVFAAPPVRLTREEIEKLLRFQQPVGQQIIVVPRRYDEN